MIKIKICGVNDPDIAAHAIALGADYIGLVFHPTSKRHVNLPLAKTIAAATIKAGGIPVAVFVDQDTAAMQTILDTTNIQTLQLHGDNAKASHHQLAHHFTRIYVQAIHTDGSLVDDMTGGLKHCTLERDYLLMDNLEAGKGIALPWDALSQHSTRNPALGNTMDSLDAGSKVCRGTPCGCPNCVSVAPKYPEGIQSISFRFGLAGGLNPANVATAIEQVKPDFVDVSSGVEATPGEKDLELIAAFIQQARGLCDAHI